MMNAKKSTSKSLWLGRMGLVISVWLSLTVVSQASTPLPPIKLALIEGLSGPFGNTGESVYRNLSWAAERVNQRGGVKLKDGMHPLEVIRFDSKSNAEEALIALKNAVDNEIRVVLQGNSSAVALALSDAIQKHNEREPDKRVLFLNYSAVEPSLTNEKCSFWHFRFDAHADMRLNALLEVLKTDNSVTKVYLIGQDYSFGQYVLRQARARINQIRPDIQIVGEELHPMGRVKDFLPYASKIKASGAQAVVTGNWGNDMTLLIRAAKDMGVRAKFFTFYGNALGAPAAIGEAGLGQVLAVNEWHPNQAGTAGQVFYQAFRQRFPKAEDQYLYVRQQVMMDMLVQAMEKAGQVEAKALALSLEGMSYGGVPAAKSAAPLGVDAALRQTHSGYMRAQDHQFIQPLLVSVMDKQGSSGVLHDVEGSGFGFRTVWAQKPEQTALPSSCAMQRP
jgi:branched-chain amino acid transport system substrate-binding protein